MLWGSRAAHWVSLSPFAMDAWYHVLVFTSGFYRAYKTLRVSLRSVHLLSLVVALDLVCGTLAFYVFGTRCLSPCLSVYSTKVMARCSPLSEIATANVAEAKNPDVVDSLAGVAQAIGGGEMLGDSDGESHALSAGRSDDSADGGASDDENSRMYYFGALTITLGKIKEMVEKGYFAESEARAPRAEAVPEPNNDDVVVYEDFFDTGLCMSPHPALADILLHFQAQLHYLTPNAIAQLSKYFWAIGSFRGRALK
jgi:hypothetical protein